MGEEYYFLDNDVILIRDSYSGEEADTHPAKLSYCQAVTDNQGSIVAVFDNNQNRVFEASYDAWGKQTVTLDEIDLHHGYTGHEMLFRSGLIHMDGRVYDASIGRFLSPDNYVPTNDLQGFNRYSYCLNNPLRYVDPDGNFPWLVLAAAGAINMAATWDEGSGFLYHLASFGVGAGAAAVGMYGTPLAIVGSGALLGTGNYTNSTTFGGGDFAFEGFLKSGVIGGASAALGSVVGAAISPLADKIASGISNKIVSRAVSNAVGGAATGGALGAAFSFNDPETSFLEGALRGFRDGALAGAISGIAQGFVEYQQARASTQNILKAYDETPLSSSQETLTPYEKGQAGVNRAIEEFTAQGGTLLNTEVTIGVDATRTRVDFIGRDKYGMLQLFEVKNGPSARFTTNQKIVIPRLKIGTPFIPYGKNAIKAGFIPKVQYTGKYQFYYIHYR